MYTPCWVWFPVVPQVNVGLGHVVESRLQAAISTIADVIVPKIYCSLLFGLPSLPPPPSFPYTPLCSFSRSLLLVCFFLPKPPPFAQALSPILSPPFSVPSHVFLSPPSTFPTVVPFSSSNSWSIQLGVRYSVALHSAFNYLCVSGCHGCYARDQVFYIWYSPSQCLFFGNIGRSLMCTQVICHS